jgi:hypothetical protein
VSKGPGIGTPGGAVFRPAWCAKLLLPAKRWGSWKRLSLWRQTVTPEEPLWVLGGVAWRKGCRVLTSDSPTSSCTGERR